MMKSLRGDNEWIASRATSCIEEGRRRPPASVYTVGLFKLI